MLDQEQLARLKRGVEEWNQWRKENLKVEIKLWEANLWEANLSGAKLNGANLHQADLHGANLSGAYLRGAHLRGANLYEANLHQADLHQADLDGANLCGANLCGANLYRAYLYEANLSQANLSQANLYGANLCGANLCGANLCGADLREVDLRGANLLGSDLRGANLREAELIGANLREANLRGAYLRGAYLRGAYLRGADLREFDLREFNLTGTDLTGADFSGANLYGANLCGANLCGAKALNTDFTWANLTGACIQDWHINAGTIFWFLICDYIYYKIDEEGTYQDRRPHDPNKIFNPGDFQRLIETARETVDLIFSDGIDWKAFLESFHGLQIESENGELSIAGILKKRDGTFVIQIDAPQDTDKAELENRFYQVYEQKLTLIEQHYQAKLANKEQEITHRDQELLQLYREKSTDMTEIAKLLANRPMTIEAKAVSYGEIKQAGNFGVGVNQGEIKDNAKVAGILNEAEQQNLTEIITEVQAIITPLAQTYPNNPTTQGIKAIEAIEKNPNLKQKLIEAAKKGCLEAFKKSLDNPVGALIGGAIEGWMGK